ncbi:hypothetical protein Pyn_35135 [Prunus yedoensis var. nudiflora]|uniref:Uncharacterized protein n=1 Tax=Prunus yedoensis var. nudiflora TaxID=2094558 RepID=A0A314ZKI8_PRUYE|nr:hypothetical protein Pyn_35135 [Prunus yedoensis var. nudiflora]
MASNSTTHVMEDLSRPVLPDLNLSLNLGIDWEPNHEIIADSNRQLTLALNEQHDCRSNWNCTDLLPLTNDVELIGGLRLADDRGIGSKSWPNEGSGLISTNDGREGVGLDMIGTPQDSDPFGLSPIIRQVMQPKDTRRAWNEGRRGRTNNGGTGRGRSSKRVGGRTPQPEGRGRKREPKAVVFGDAPYSERVEED